MLYACAARFDVTWNLKHFAKIFREVNKALMLYACAARFNVTENLKKFLSFGEN